MFKKVNDDLQQHKIWKIVRKDRDTRVKSSIPHKLWDIFKIQKN